MADKNNTTGAVHIASLGLDLSPIKGQLQELQDWIREAGESIPRSFREGMTGMETLDWLKQIGISEDNLDTAYQKIELLKEQLGSFDKLEITTKGGDLFKAAITSTDELGRSLKTVLDLTKTLGEFQDNEVVRSPISTSYSDNAKKNAQELLKIQKEIDQDLEKYISTQEKAEAQASKLTTEELSFLREKESEQAKAISQLNSYSKAYEQLANSVRNSNLSNDNKNAFLTNINKVQDMIAQIKLDIEQGFGLPKNISHTFENFERVLIRVNTQFKGMVKDKTAFDKLKSDIQKITQDLTKLGNLDIKKGIKNEISRLSDSFKDLYAKIESGDITVDDAQKRFEQLKNEFGNLEIKAKSAGGGVSDFISKLSDKFKWLMAYQFIMMIQNAFSQVISTIKGTEDAVIELQRVLNDSSLSNSAISDALYDIAYRYGQTFENVQETAVLFAQTGMDFNEVLQATEATMLGLNTAELEVTTATQGLIAVMSQFNLDASELNDVIDKINITADNFPVTSEKIVAALQRAGSAAYNYGLTLEETISIITALSEATGRAGANLGTALNSLINFSMKPESLKTFSDYLGGISLAGLDVLDVWTLLGNSIKDGGEELGKLMAESAEFADLFSEEMAEAVGAMDEYTAAVGNAEGVYQTAGVYRKNYFIALLNNIETVTDALQNMGKAEGYSVEENEKYMDTLTAQWNQLVIAAQELAVQFGESGFLQILKWIVDFSTGVVKATNSVGGLRTILSLLFAVLLQIKGAKFAEVFYNIKDSVNLAKTAFEYFIIELKATKSITASLTSTMQALNLNIDPILLTIGLLATAWSALSNIMKEAKEKAEELRQEEIQQGAEAQKNLKNLSSVYNAYKQAKEGTEEYTSALNNLLTVLGYQEEDTGIIISRYEELTGKTGTLSDAIDNLAESEYRLLKVQAEAGKKTAEEAFGDIERTSLQLSNRTEAYRKTIEVLTKAGYDMQTMFDAYYNTPTSLEGAKEQLKTLNDQIKILDENLLSTEKGTGSVYSELVLFAGALQKTVNEAQSYDDLLNILGDSFVDFANKARESTETASEGVSSFTGDLTKLSYELQQVNDNYDTAKEKIEGFSKAYSTVLDVINEYNKSGVMTADMLTKLLELEPEYIELLAIKNGQIELNNEQVSNLIGENDNYLNQLIALKVAEESYALAQELSAVALGTKTLEEIKSSAAMRTMSNDLANAVLGMINGTGTTATLTAAIEGLGKTAGVSGEALAYLKEQVQGYVNMYSNLANLVTKENLGTFYSGKGTADNPAKKALEEEVKEWKRQKDAVKDSYDTQIKEIQKLKKEKEDYYDQEIDKLKEVEKKNDRINKQLDYYADRQKILTNLEQAQSRSGIEWRQKEIEYQQDLTDLDNDWRKTLSEWDIDDQIDELERLKKEQSDYYDAQIDRLKEMQSAAVKAIEETITTLQDKISDLTNKIFSATGGFYKKQKDDSSKTSDEIVAETEEKVANSHKKMYNDIQEVYFGPLESDIVKTVDNSTGYMRGQFGIIAKDMKEILTKNIKLAAVESLSIWKANFSDKIKDSIAFNMGNLGPKTKDMSFMGITQSRSVSQERKTVESANVNVYVGNINSPADADVTASKVTDALNKVIFN